MKILEFDEDHVKPHALHMLLKLLYRLKIVDPKITIESMSMADVRSPYVQRVLETLKKTPIP